MKDLGHLSLVKDNNIRKITRIIWENSPVSRTSLSHITGLNKATVSNLVAELEEKGMIKHVGQQKSAAGRSRNLIMLNETYGICACVHFTIKHVEVGISTIYAKIIWKESFGYTVDTPQHIVLNRIAELIKEGIEKCSHVSKNLLGVGIGVPSLVNKEIGALYGIDSLSWYNIPIGQYLKQYFDVPIYFETAACNELLADMWFGISKNFQNVIYLAIGYGIGAGILVNGQLVHGSNGFAGDVSHMVINQNGELCPCGNRGCWELDASLLYIKDLDFNDIVMKAENRDSKAIMILDHIGRNIGYGVAKLIRILNPQLVLISGNKIIRGGNWILNPCNLVIQKSLSKHVYHSTIIRMQERFTNQGLIGSAMQVIQQLF